MDSERAAELILKSRIELTLITPDDIKKPLNTIKLCSDPMQYVVVNDHELAKYQTVNIETLSGPATALQEHLKQL